jgi:hypothetical protein
LVGSRKNDHAGSLLRWLAGSIETRAPSLASANHFRAAVRFGFLPKRRLDFSRQSLGIPAESQPFRCIRAGSGCAPVVMRFTSRKAESCSARSTVRAPGRDPLLLLTPFAAYTLSHTWYRTIPFDNLRPTCKSRAYWGFEKFRADRVISGSRRCVSQEGSNLLNILMQKEVRAEWVGALASTTKKPPPGKWLRAAALGFEATCTVVGVTAVRTLFSLRATRQGSGTLPC